MLNGEWHICRLFCIYKGLLFSETCALFEESILRTPVQNHDAPPMNISNCHWLHFCHTCSLCRVELVVQFLARGSTQVLLCLFPGVLWLWHFLYSVSLHPVSSLHIYYFVESRAFMAGVASQAWTLTPPGHLVSPLVCRGPWMSTVVFYCWCHSDSASVLLHLTLMKTQFH